jgi:iron complex transport system substrate-binding protein
VAAAEEIVRRYAILIAVLALVVSLAVRSAADPPKRIISIVPATTEMIFAIGGGPEVVAVSSYDKFPEEVAKLPKVGALLDPDVERILSLRPDLVIAYGTQSNLREQLARTKIAVYAYRHGGLADAKRTILELGELTGRVTEARALVARLDAELDGIRRRVAHRPRRRTLLVFGREPLALRNVYASGGYGFLHDMLDIAGGANVFGDVKRESVQMTAETILARQPEVILELRVGAEPPAEERARTAASWNILSAVPAVRDGRVHLLWGEELVVPGPRIAAGTLRLARALHPEAFR